MGAPMQSVEGADVGWIFTSTALVLVMTPGLAFFYGGHVNDKSIINTMMMCFISMGCVSVVWALLGFSLAFGDGGPYIGTLDYAMLEGLDMHVWADTSIPGLCFATFQMTFAVVSAAIISGSLVERMQFLPYIIFISLWTLVVYVPLCHWVWGPGGWIEELGAVDFAGGLVVHVSAGVSGYTAAALLGPRLHGKEEEHLPANVPFVLLGAGLLWFGWNGFNGGSALSIGDGIASRAICTTNLAAAVSMLEWVIIEWVFKGRPSGVGAVVGAVAGLVCITPAAGFVSPMGGMFIGLLGTPICYAATHSLHKPMVDDSLDAFGLHGVGGMAGALLTGLFALDGGAFYGGGFSLLGKQAISMLAATAYSAAGTAVIILPLRLCCRLHVSKRQQDKGIDKYAHDESAYSKKSLTNQDVSDSELDDKSSTNDSHEQGGFAC